MARRLTPIIGVILGAMLIATVIVWRTGISIPGFTPSSAATAIPGGTALLTPPPTPAASGTPPPVSVQVDVGAGLGRSAFQPGYSYIDNTFSGSALPAASAQRLKTMLQAAAPVQNSFIQGWGVGDLWPDPSTPDPTNWQTLDANVSQMRALSANPVLSLCEAPWWMKGVPEPDGSTKLLTLNDEWSDDAYGARILDNKMDAWLHLVQRIAERYMAPPYNVRSFQVWNEMKGYFNPVTSTYDYDLSAGDPSGPHTEHGYTYMYNRVYDTLMQVADALHIARNTIKVGGPYVAMDSWSSANYGAPSALVKPYGVFDERPLDVLGYWLQHKNGAGFITLSVTATNKDGGEPADPFTAATKFADLVTYIRTLDPAQYPGATNLPIWLAEWYAAPFSTTNNAQYVAAVKAYALLRFIQAGGAVALQWGGQGEGTTNGGMWSSPDKASGGVPQPWYFALSLIRSSFTPGTPVFLAPSSRPDQVAALASDHVVVLINLTGKPLSVAVAGHDVYLSPYAVVGVKR